VFCACEIIQLPSVLFSVARAVNKFDFRLVINETPNKWRPVEDRAVIETRVFDRISVFSSYRRREC
jgi:hypothetical protein